MYLAFACAWLALTAGGVAQQAPPPATELDAAEPTAEHLAQIGNCRAGILDVNARPEDRRRWIDTLLAFDTPHAKALVVELLQTAESSAVRQSLCEVIAEQGRKSPHRVDAGYVDPLVDLLGAESRELRAAAARALADYPGRQLPARLGAIAASREEPLVKRLAAIDALAAKVNRREVVHELMALLEVGELDITQQVLRALEPATREPYGEDIGRWREWWSAKAQLSEEEWLADRLEMYLDRYHERSEEYTALQEVTRQRVDALAARLITLQREVFRGLTAEQREQRLVEWLGDPVTEVRQSALQILQARIADEGIGPEGAVLAALLPLLDDKPADMRREVVVIVQNLNDPAVIQAVLAQLARERDPVTRHAIFRAIGKMGSAAALPALIGEIQTPDSPAACVREAALSLGQIADKLDDDTQRQNAVAALRSRYQRIQDGDTLLRAALLSAMAGVADGSFAPEFQEAVEATEAVILRPAIRGLATIGDRSKLPRIRALSADADPLVRLAATDALAELGGEDADLESLLTRLNPAIEANDLVREAAWRAFCSMVAKRPVAEQIKAAERLRDMPDLKVNFLAELSNRLSITGGNGNGAETVRDRLATVLVSQQKYDAAAPHLRELFEFRAERDDPRAFDVGLRWLEAALHNHPQQAAHETLLRLSSVARSPEQRSRIFETVETFFDSMNATTEIEAMERLLVDLRSLSDDAVGEGWTPLLDRVASRLGQPAPENSDAPPG